MIRAIIFDFDGIVVDSEPLHFQAFLRIAERDLNVSFSYEDYLREYVGYDDRDGFRAIAGRSDITKSLDDQTLATMITDKAAAFEAIVEEGVVPIPGVLEFIPHAKAAMPIAIASGAGRADIDLILKHMNLLDSFPIIVSADDVAHSKPDPSTYRMAVEQLAATLPGLQPAQCVAIEDTAGGIASARSAGLQVLGMTTTSNAAALKNAHRVVDNFAGLTVEQLQAWFG